MGFKGNYAADKSRPTGKIVTVATHILFLVLFGFCSYIGEFHTNGISQSSTKLTL